MMAASDVNNLCKANGNRGSAGCAKRTQILHISEAATRNTAENASLDLSDHLLSFAESPNLPKSYFVDETGHAAVGQNARASLATANVRLPKMAHSPLL